MIPLSLLYTPTPPGGVWEDGYKRQYLTSFYINVLSCLNSVWLWDPMDCSPPASMFLCPWDSPGKTTGEGCHALLQGIFPNQGSTCVSWVSCMARRVFTTSATWEAAAFINYFYTINIFSYNYSPSIFLK